MVYEAHPSWLTLRDDRARPLAMVALARQDLDEANDAISKALELLDRFPKAVPYPQRVWLRSAKVAEARGEHDRAKASMKVASEILNTELGHLESRQWKRSVTNAFPWNREIVSFSTKRSS